MSNQNYPTSGPDGTIPVQDGIDWAQNWREYLTKSGQAFKVQSFEIPICDFKNIIKFNKDAESVRAYIGLEDPTDPSTAKLILVPVVDGHDVVVVPTMSDDGELGEGDQSNVYDVTKPCPPTCPIGSPIGGF